MFSQEQLNALLSNVMSNINRQQSGTKNIIKTGTIGGNGNSNGNWNASNVNNNGSSCSGIFDLTPSQILVIAGILCGGLEVESLLIDKDQTVQILLSGSLKRKTELEKAFDEIGTLPFDEVLKAMIGRL